MRAQMPMGQDKDEEPRLLGMALGKLLTFGGKKERIYELILPLLQSDFTSSSPVPVRESPDDPPFPPSPILLFLTNEGFLCSYYYIKTDSLDPHPFMCTPQPIPPVPNSPTTITTHHHY